MATAWGSRHGGINVFNFDLCTAVAAITGGRCTIRCVVLSADQDDVEQAARHNVTLSLCCAVAIEDDDAKRCAEWRVRDRLGYVYYLRREFVRARMELVRSIRLHRKPSRNRSELSRAFNNLGKVFAARGCLAAARRYFGLSCGIKCARGDARGQAVCLQEIGLTHRAEGDLEKAKALLGESLAIKVRIEDLHGAGLALMELGVTTRPEVC